MSRNLQLQVVLSALDKATAPIKAIMGSSAGLGAQLKQTRDQLKGLQAQQSNIQSFKSLKEASEQSKQAMSAQQEKVKALAASMRQTEVPTKAMTKEFQAATREAHRLKQNHGANTQQLQAMRGRLSEAGISTKNLSEAERNLRGRISETNKSLTDQQSKLKSVAEQQKRLSEAKAQYESSAQLASNMTTAGAGALAAGGGVLYGGAKLAQTGMEFDTSMSKVQSLARLEIDSSEMQALREQARKLGAETMFSATEAAQGQGFLAMAGFTPQAMLDAMPGMLDIAKAGDMDLARTADISSNILTGMNLEAADMARVGDILVGTFTRSNTSLESLGETMKYVAPVAASVGQDIETVAAMAGKLGDAGIQGSMGGTALRSILNRLSSPPAAAAKALDKLGISAKDAQGNMRDMPAILTELYDKTKMMGNADRAAALKEIAGSEAVSAMQVLVKQAGSGELQEFVTTLRNSQGEASETARKMADNLTGDLDAFFSAFDDVKIEAFEGQNSALRDLAKSATAAMASFGAWAKENPELLGTLIKGVLIIAGLVAAGGALMLTIGSVLGPLAMMKYALTVVGVKGGFLIPIIKGIGSAMMLLGKTMLANPIFIAIALLAAAAFLIYKNWDGVIGGLKLLWGSLSSFFSDVWGQIKTAFDSGVAAVGALVSTFTEFGSSLIAGFLSGVSTAWASIKEFFASLWASISSAFDGGIAGIGALIMNWSPLGLFYEVFAGVMSYFGVDLPGKFSEFGGMIMQGLINGIKNMASGVKDAVVGMGDSVGGWFKDKLGIKSPSRVFMQFGDDTAEGLALGISANKDSPLKQVASMAKQVAAAGAIALGVSVTPAVADNNQQLKQNLQPVAIPEVQDQQQRILQSVQSVTPPATQDQQQQIKQSLQIAAIPAVQDQQQRILQSVQPVAMPPVPAVQAQKQALPSLTQNIQQMIISAKQVLPDLTQRIIGVFSDPKMAAGSLQQKLAIEQPAIAFDTRAPIASPAAQRIAPQAASNITINVNPSPGMDEALLAQLVQRELEKAQRQQQVRTRSRIGDLD